MKAELENNLLNEYSEFFRTDRKIYTNEELMNGGIEELLNQTEMVLPIQFGFECGDGWYMLLNELMDEIRNHLINENRNRANVFKYQWMWNLQRWLRVRTPASQTILRDLGDWIYENAPRKNLPPITVQIDQIKEKFGGLRFYYSGGDRYIDGITSFAESLSYKICEDCGSTQNIGYTQGWITTMCKDCYEKHPKKEIIRWDPIENK